jgi:hypothetical protein
MQLTTEPEVVMIDDVRYTPHEASLLPPTENEAAQLHAGVTSFQNGTAFSGYVANSRIASLLSDRQNILLCVGLLIAADYFALLSHVSALTNVC